jgi:uncharacterized membrane protein YcaP (DUF421 family)
METVLKSVCIYLLLLVFLRISGKRTLHDVTLFDFVLLLFISEATNQAMLGEDFSLINSIIVIVTLVITDIIFSLLKQKSKKLDKILDGMAVIIVENGRPLKDRMEKERVDEDDVLEAARQLQGLERMEQIKYAVLEKNGAITIIPKEKKS